MMNIYPRKLRNRTPLLYAVLIISLLYLCYPIALNRVASTASAGLLQKAHAQSCPPNAIERFGVNVAREAGPITDYPTAQLNLGWWMDYRFRNTPNSPRDTTYARLIRSHFNTANLESTIGPIVDENLGSTWLAGNEPDRVGQDGVTAEEYALFYHDVYTFIKGRDPSATVVFGGVTTPTTLRQKYLDNVMAEYQRLYGQAPPMDVMHVHGFVMSEKVDPNDPASFWGAGVPPGMSATDLDALRLEPHQHWDLDIFTANIVSFRQWMSAKGYRNVPLWVSEYGILLPDGLDSTNVGTANFMTGTFDYFLHQTDGAIGLPTDDNRLVQRFAWFSLNFPDGTPQGPLNGALFVPNTDQLTAIGQAYVNYTNTLIQSCNSEPLPLPDVTLTVAHLPVAVQGSAVEIPFTLNAAGSILDTGSITLDLDDNCLSVSSISFHQDEGAYDAASSTVTFANAGLSDGPLLTLSVQIKATCPPYAESIIGIGSATFSVGSDSVDASGEAGDVYVIANDPRGDCNGDGAVNAGDFTAIALETFDDDNNPDGNWYGIHAGEYAGSPLGCDANADQQIDVSDIIRTSCLFFEEPTCSGQQ